MRIPKFEVEKRQQVQARIPVSEVTQLKALAVANAVPVSRVLHYAVECLLEAARAADPAVLRSGMVGRDQGAPVMRLPRWPARLASMHQNARRRSLRLLSWLLSSPPSSR